MPGRRLGVLAWLHALNQWVGDRAGAQWGLFLTLSGLLIVLLEILHLPAAILLGSMGAAICVAACGWAVRIPWQLFVLAQGVLGCMIARTMVPSIYSEVLKNWPVFFAAVLSVIAASSILGWLLTRRRLLPGTTAMWGLSPGAATAVILMADAYDADARLVAFMQYLRIALAAIVASVVSTLWVAPGPEVAVAWFPPVLWEHFAGTVAVIVVGLALASFSGIPAGALLIPLGLGAVLQNTGVVVIELPPMLLAASFAVIGWSIGLRFTRPVLLHCAKAFPSVLASICVLIAICGGFAAVLTYGFGIDPLTAYLATSPGGVDSIAIIAASAHVDMPFVMALQTVRFVMVIVLGPLIAKFVSRRMSARTD